jgi:phage terminase large subunit-like protein
LLYGLAAKIVRLSARLSENVACKDSLKTLVCPTRGTVYRALSAEASTAYGLSPAFVVHDELGVVRGPRSELFEALETATSAQLAPLSIVISTQAPTDSDLLSILIDDGLAANDPHTVCLLHTAPPDADPFSLETIRLANPAFAVHQNPQEVLQMAADAKRMPAREASFRRLVLNQRVEASSPFVTPAQWMSCAGAPIDLRGRDVFASPSMRSITALPANRKKSEPSTARAGAHLRASIRCSDSGSNRSLRKASPNALPSK